MSKWKYTPMPSASDEDCAGEIWEIIDSNTSRLIYKPRTDCCGDVVGEPTDDVMPEHSSIWEFLDPFDEYVKEIRDEL